MTPIEEQIAYWQLHGFPAYEICDLLGYPTMGWLRLRERIERDFGHWYWEDALADQILFEINPKSTQGWREAQRL